MPFLPAIPPVAMAAASGGAGGMGGIFGSNAFAQMLMSGAGLFGQGQNQGPDGVPMMTPPPQRPPAPPFPTNIDPWGNGPPGMNPRLTPMANPILQKFLAKFGSR